MVSIAPPKNTGPDYEAIVAHKTGRNLPEIIDGPGLYQARNGAQVKILEVRPPEQATANCTGHFSKTTPSGRVKWEYSIWQANGRFKFLDEHPLDVVAKL